MKRIIKAARARLKASEDAVKTVVHQVELVTKKHSIERTSPGYPNPREYRRAVPPPYIELVRKDFEKLGFNFRRLPVHSPDTKALEAEGRYKSVHYILDLIINHDTMEVDLYY